MIEKTNKDRHLRSIRQAIENNEPRLLLPIYRKIRDDLSLEIGLVMYSGKIVVLQTLRQLVVQMAHGDPERFPKMENNLEMFYWPKLKNDFIQKAKQCLTCFRTGENLKTFVPNCQIHRLPPSKKSAN